MACRGIVLFLVGWLLGVCGIVPRQEITENALFCFFAGRYGFFSIWTVIETVLLALEVDVRKIAAVLRLGYAAHAGRVVALNSAGRNATDVCTADLAEFFGDGLCGEVTIFDAPATDLARMCDCAAGKFDDATAVGAAAFENAIGTVALWRWLDYIEITERLAGKIFERRHRSTALFFCRLFCGLGGG